MADKIKSEVEKELETEINSVDYFIEKSPKTGDYTLALKKEGKKQYVLSKYKPREQAIEQLNNRDWGNKSTVWILIGYGFGYMTKAILDKVGNNTLIIIIEPNQKLLEEQLRLAPVKKEATNTYTLYTLNTIQLYETLNLLIPETELNNINIRYLNGYLEYYNLFCKFIIDNVATRKSKLQITFDTVIAHETEVYLNCLKNGRYYSENCDIYKLTMCENIPALIVCAGPSLEKNINDIKNFKGIIIAIGRTMTPLLKRGIRPDFVVSIDATDLIYETFGEYKEHDVPLLTLAQGNSKVVASSYGVKYFMHDHPIVTTIFKTEVNPNTALFGSASTLCLSFAEFLGCNPIMIVGQDLAYTGNKIHTGNNSLTDEEFLFYVPDAKKIKDFYGNTVMSGEIWRSVISWMESQICEYPDIIHINATEGGAYIEGMLHMPLQEAIKTYCTKDKPKIIHTKLEASKEINYEKCMKEAKNSIQKIYRLSKAITRYYQQLEVEYAKDSKKNWNKIDQIYDNLEKAEKGIERVPNSKALIEILLKKVKMVLEANNKNKAQIDEAEWEENVRIMHHLYERYYYLSIECERFIRLIDIAMTDE